MLGIGHELVCTLMRFARVSQWSILNLQRPKFGPLNMKLAKQKPLLQNAITVNSALFDKNLKMANNGMSCLLFEVRFGFLVTLTFSDEHDQAKPRINRSKSSKFFAISDVISDVSKFEK